MGMREAYQEKVTAHLKDLSTKLADLRAKAGPAAARLKEVSEATWKEARPGIEQAWQELRGAVQRAANSGGRGQQHEPEATRSADANKATIRRMIEAFNTRDLTFIDDGFSPHFVLHTALTPGWPRGLEGARQLFTAMLTTAPDVQGTIEDMVTEGEKVAVRWTFRGTHTGESALTGVPTGAPFTLVAISIYRFADGKIVEDWGVDVQWQSGVVWE
jgi:predicted ester cyclase